MQLEKIRVFWDLQYIVRLIVSNISKDAYLFRG